MKLFTTDLDRTMIFSERTFGRPLEQGICIEHYEGRSISYVTPQLLEQLQQLQDKMVVVPVTTRSLEQFQRIQLFNGIFHPRVAITTNGGIILRDGEIDQNWQQHIQAQMNAIAPILAIQQQLEQRLPTMKFTVVDDLFMVCRQEGSDLVQIRQDTLADLQAAGWTSYVNGRKFYVLPSFLTKEAAVRYIKQDGFTEHFAAGDSIMDLGMLQLADHAYIPQHGELATIYPNDFMPFIGVAFAEHCLQKLNTL